MKRDAILGYHVGTQTRVGRARSKNKTKRDRCFVSDSAWRNDSDRESSSRFGRASRDGKGAFSINYLDRGGAAARPNSRVARTEESDARSSPPVQR